MAYDVSQTRAIIFETQDAAELAVFMKEELPRFEAETSVESASHQKRFVCEFHEEIAFWVLYSETVLKPECGGHLFQEQTMEHLVRQREINMAKAAGASAEI